ncbi:MAG: hypothetical protein HC904_01870 [Blastochloris sp.]|nr:hypothetical protein [Blastochloris sp.]
MTTLPNLTHLILIGMMGSGKTSVGRQLAHQHGLAFVDTDQEIEMEYGQGIPALFAQHGEPVFRKMEQATLSRLLQREDHVIFPLEEAPSSPLKIANCSGPPDLWFI